MLGETASSYGEVWHVPGAGSTTGSCITIGDDIHAGRIKNGLNKLSQPLGGMPGDTFSSSTPSSVVSVLSSSPLSPSSSFSSPLSPSSVFLVRDLCYTCIQR